jgi:hypothetical protein
MPNSSWEAGFEKDMKTAEAALVALARTGAAIGSYVVDRISVAGARLHNWSMRSTANVWLACIGTSLAGLIGALVLLLCQRI